MLRHKSVLSLVMMICFSSALLAQRSSTLPSGKEIKVRADQQITADANSAGRTYPGTVSEAVTDSAGNTLIPKGAQAELTTVATGSKVGSKVAVDLTSVTIDGNRYMIEASSYKPGGVGVNKTTAKYAGGGALAGAVIGALAGGAKGAIIGTLAGGAAGAGAQVLTSGKKVNVPAEAVLTFKTAQALRLRQVASGTRR